MIRVERKHLKKILIHAENIYPEECCGLLLGKINFSDKTLVEVIPTENSWHSEIGFSESDYGETNDDENYCGETNIDQTNKNPNYSDIVSQPSKRNRFSISPDVILQVQKNARNLSLNIIGVYHSHPNGIPIPSEFDRSIAWHQYSYLIQGVSNGKAGEIKSWVLDDNHQFRSENIIII